MVMGELKEVSGPFGPELTCAPIDDIPLSEQLDGAIQNIHAQITEYEFDDVSNYEEVTIPADPNVRNFSYTVVDGDIYFRENSLMRKIEMNATAENRVKGMIELRDCVRTLIEYQTENYSDDEIKAQQAKLNTLYDDFIKKYGLINSRGNALAFSEDSSYFLLCSLEILDENGEEIGVPENASIFGEEEQPSSGKSFAKGKSDKRMVLRRKADMFTKRTIGAKHEVTKVDMQFVDVDSGAWYAHVMSKAVSAGVVAGYEDGTVKPENLITREDAAVILYRVIKSRCTLPKNEKKFADIDKCSEYAQEAVTIMAAAGIINGMDKNHFMPKENTTRAQIAVLLMNAADYSAAH